MNVVVDEDDKYVEDMEVEEEEEEDVDMNYVTKKFVKLRF